jgi:hypothetical protein
MKKFIYEILSILIIFTVITLMILTPREDGYQIDQHIGYNYVHMSVEHKGKIIYDEKKTTQFESLLLYHEEQQKLFLFLKWYDLANRDYLD